MILRVVMFAVKHGFIALNAAINADMLYFQ